MQPYDAQFFEKRINYSVNSAKVIVPWLVGLLNPQSVVDVGCASGTWLRYFEEAGVSKILGIDGKWVNDEILEIPKECFVRRDLATEALPDERFDLVVSVEVAEHLPESSADSFVDRLCRLGDLVFFSAAVPGQGGTHHLNEQWQDYWTSRFARQGFVLIDCFRGRFWEDSNVAVWYRQNAFFFVRSDQTAVIEKLRAERDRFPLDGKAMVHPELFAARVHRARHPGIVLLLKRLPEELARSVRYRLTGKST